MCHFSVQEELDEIEKYLRAARGPYQPQGKLYMFPDGPIIWDLTRSLCERYRWWEGRELCNNGFCPVVWKILDTDLEKYLEYWDIKEYFVIDLDQNDS